MSVCFDFKPIETEIVSYSCIKRLVIPSNRCFIRDKCNFASNYLPN